MPSSVSPPADGAARSSRASSAPHPRQIQVQASGESIHAFPHRGGGELIGIQQGFEHGRLDGGVGEVQAALAVLALRPAAFLVLPRFSRPGLTLLTALPALLVVLQLALGVATLRQQLAQPALTVGHQLTAALLIAVLAALWGRSLPVVPSTSPSLPEEVLHG